MNTNNKFLLLILSCLSIFSFSCRKFLEIPPPKNQLVNSEVFTDSADATNAVIGIYISMMQAFSLNIGSGGLTLSGRLPDCVRRLHERWAGSTPAADPDRTGRALSHGRHGGGCVGRDDA